VSFTSFKDQSLSDSMAILSLIDCIAPKKINWDYVKEGGSDEVKPSAENFLFNCLFKLYFQFVFSYH